MADVNVQIKQRNGAIWDSLYPKTKADLVEETTSKRFVSDSEKSNWGAKQNALGFTPEDKSEKGALNGYASLGADGKIPNSELPLIAIVDTFPCSSQIEQLALSVQKGDICIRTDLSKSFINFTGNNTTITDWQEILTPDDAVSSINGKTGSVTLTTTDVNEGNKQYYTEARVSANTDVSANTTHRNSAHAPSNAQKNSDITKAEIEAKLIGTISSHSHASGTPTAHASTHVTGGTDVIPIAVSGGNSGLMSGGDKARLIDLNKINVGSTAPSSPLSGDFWYEII